MACEDLNLPDLAESDPGKPIKASWGDRVVEAISTNCETIEGFGYPNSVFDIYGGDGSDGNFDTAIDGLSVASPLATGLQFDNLIIRATNTLAILRGVDNFGIIRVGVQDTLTIEAGGFLSTVGQGGAGGAGGAGVPINTTGLPGATGEFYFPRIGLGNPTSGGGGGGGGHTVVFLAGINGGTGHAGGTRLIAGPAVGGAPGIGPNSPGGVAGGGAFAESFSLDWWKDASVLTPAMGGGGGGSGGNTFLIGLSAAGGAGGAGGAALWLECNKLNILTPGVKIFSNGGAGLAGAANGGVTGHGGGGGGAPGGYIVMTFRELLALTFLPGATVGGGAAGLGGAGGASPGGNGGPGRPGLAIVQEI